MKMPSKTLRKTLAVLDLLSKIKDNNHRNAILSQLGHESKLFCSLSEICKNIINGNLPLKNSDKKYVKKYKTIIVEIANNPRSIKDRKRLINQTGGAFWLALLPIAITAISELVHHLRKQ